MAATKRARLEEESTKREKEPKLKCHEMRLIFQRLPTSELIRFVSSQPKHPLGKFWSQELKFVVEKRLPFSIKAIATASGSTSDHVIFDCNGSRVAQIKHPEHFHLAPLCELIESAELPAIASNASSLPPRFVFPTPDILSLLTNLDSLTVSGKYLTRPRLLDPVHLATALNPELMSRISSLTLTGVRHYLRFGKSISEILTRAVNLKKLTLANMGEMSEYLLAALPSQRDAEHASLESLRILYSAGGGSPEVLELITTRFSGLRELFVPVNGPMRQYLVAFQSLPSLTTLGLSATQFSSTLEANEKELSVDENDVPAITVTELYVVWKSTYGKEPQALLKMLSKFPNVRSFGADFHSTRADYSHIDFLLRYASAVCSSGILRHLQALKLFSGGHHYGVSSDALLQFIRANIDHLPSSVDLSQVPTNRPTNVNRDFLVDLCTTLQGGRITSLALKVLVHREAVPRLREHFALIKQETTTGVSGKVLQWIDEDSIEERSRLYRTVPVLWRPFSEFTDFRIEACKTSGPLKGSAFEMRISDWTEERERLFEV